MLACLLIGAKDNTASGDNYSVSRKIARYFIFYNVKKPEATTINFCVQYLIFLLLKH